MKRMTTEQAADYLMVAPATLKAWRARKTGPAYYKIGSRVWYDLAELEKFIDEGKVVHGKA